MAAVHIDVAALLDIPAFHQINDVLGDVLAMIADPLQRLDDEQNVDCVTDGALNLPSCR
jgi:hypothetical protein